MYHKSVPKVNAIGKIQNNSGLLSITDYDSDKQNLEKKIEDVDKKYPVLVSFSKKVITKPKLQKLKIKYLELLAELLLLLLMHKL